MPFDKTVTTCCGFARSYPVLVTVRYLAHAQLDGRVVVTFDKDFGELAFRYGLPAECVFILFRITMPSASRVAKIAVAALASRDDWASHFAVVEDDRVRMTPLP